MRGGGEVEEEVRTRIRKAAKVIIGVLNGPVVNEAEGTEWD